MTYRGIKVCVVTCTGGRPELFSLCQRWVGHQTVRPDTWIVASDDAAWPTRDGSNPASEVCYAGVPPASEDAKPFQVAAQALRTALEHVPKNHAVVIMEDDDFYHDKHIELAMGALERYPLVMPYNHWRFHVPAARKQFCALHRGQTLIPGLASFRYSELDRVREALQGEQFGHLQIWWYHALTAVSIKGVGYGLPGRPGASTKHRPDHPKTRQMIPDVGHREFRLQLGEHAQDYLDLLEKP